MSKYGMAKDRLLAEGFEWLLEETKEEIRAAIRVLEQAERYEKLIEAAGKVDKQPRGASWEKINRRGPRSLTKEGSYVQ